MEIAAGEHDILRDQFVRIKAIEALGRMRATESSELLHSICEKREGLTHAEPAGLRAAAEDALAMMENRPTSARVRAAFESATQSGANFVVPRRYARVPLESPLRAQIEKLPAGDDPHQPLHPRAFASAERSGGVKTLSRQFYELLADTGLTKPKAHRQSEAAPGRDGPRELSPISFHSLRHTATSLMKNAGICCRRPQ